MKRKLFKTKIDSIDESAMTVDVVFSTDDEDRDGEIVVQSGWDISEYSQNPVVLWGHNPSEPPVGKTLDIQIGEHQSVAKIQFAKGDEASERLFNLVRQGILKTVSAGFMNTLAEGNRLIENKLYEISWVSLPANRNAITLAYEGGMISKEDTDFMRKMYKKELDYLETLEHKATEIDFKTGEERYLYAKDCYCNKCQTVHDKIKKNGILINKEGDTVDKEEMSKLIVEQVTEAIKPLTDKLEALEAGSKETSEKLDEVVSKLPKEVSDSEAGTKPPLKDGSKQDEDGEEELTAEEIQAAVAEALAEDE